MKVKGTILKFDVMNYSRDIISPDCKIDIPERVPFLFNFDSTRPPIGYAEVVRTDDGLIFTGEIVDSDAIETLSNTYDGKECRGCGGYYTCVERDDSNVVVKMKLKSVSCTYAPVNPEYKFEIVEEGVEHEQTEGGEPEGLSVSAEDG